MNKASMSSKPTVAELNIYLKELTNWQQFALHLPGIKPANIDTITSSSTKHDDIEDEKIALYKKWLRVHPSASWADVVKALEVADEFAIASNLKQQLPAIAVSQQSSQNAERHTLQDKKESAVGQKVAAETDSEVELDTSHDDDQLNIVLLGTAGAGKSALINSLLGAKLATENAEIIPEDYPEGVKCYSESIKGIKVRCFDTNGFSRKEATLRSVVNGLKKLDVEPDLFLVCINITDNRFIPANFASDLKRLSQLYGVEKFWQKVIVAFTFTNRFELQQKDDVPNITQAKILEDLHKKADKICQIFHEELVTKSKIISAPAAREGKIQACFVGRKRKEFPNDVKLVTSDDWWLDLLVACTRVCSTSPRLKVIQSILKRVYSNLDLETLVTGFAVTAFVISRFLV